MTIIGSEIKVIFPEFENLHIAAKVDTGAYSGSLSCQDTYIKEEDGLQKLFFKPTGTDKFYSRNTYHVIAVKSSNGQKEQRYSILTKVTIQGETYPIRITLANRANMKYPVLIGRRFLKSHKFIIDPAGVLKK